MKQHDESTVEKLYTVDELAAYLRVTRVTVYRLLNDGELKSGRVGTRHRFRQQDVDDYLERQK